MGTFLCSNGVSSDSTRNMIFGWFYNLHVCFQDLTGGNTGRGVEGQTVGTIGVVDGNLATEVVEEATVPTVQVAVEGVYRYQSRWESVKTPHSICECSNTSSILKIILCCSYMQVFKGPMNLCNSA